MNNPDILPQSKTQKRGEDEMPDIQLTIHHQKEDNTKVNKHKLITKAFSLLDPTNEFYL